MVLPSPEKHWQGNRRWWAASLHTQSQKQLGEEREVDLALMLWCYPVQPPGCGSFLVLLGQESGQCLWKLDRFTQGTVISLHFSDRICAGWFAACAADFNWQTHLQERVFVSWLIQSPGVCPGISLAEVWKGSTGFCILGNVGNGSPATGSNQECVWPWLR